MASYSNINGIKSITTGDEAGTWGTSTNTNLDILDAASRGYKKITVADSNFTLPMDNNPTAVENGHYFGIEFSGANSASRTITIEQNDHALVYAFLNNTGQDLVIQQGDGSGGTVTIGNTNGAIVFCDGAGTGAKVTNLSSALNTSSADQLTNAREFSITGDITAAAVSFDGTANVALSAAITAGSIVDADINASAAIADTKLATISTASKVANSATTATDANTASAIVARDGSGNFSAGTVTAALTGDVTGNVTGNVAGNVTGDLTGDVYASNGTSKVLESGTDGTDATFTGAVTGTVSGNAGTATALASAQNFSITGDVTASAVSFNGTGAVALSAAITADTIVNADIKSDAAIVDTKLATISTSGKVSNSATTATDANTASAIVARDGSGNFSAGTITATLSGNASSASQVAVAESGNTDTDYEIVFVTGPGGGNEALYVDNATLEYNPSTETLKVPRILLEPVTSGGAGSISFEGATADAFETTITPTDPTADRTVTVPDESGTIVLKDGSGNFSAGTITAALSGNATTATTLETARTIAGQSFNGSANISIGPTDLTGVTASASDINTASTHYVPSGGIIMWSGAIVAIPTGWVLCDGNNSTPDLRDRFIVGAGSTYAVDDTGGAASVTLTTDQIPSHSHANTASSSSTSSVSDPGHNHELRINGVGATSGLFITSGEAGTPTYSDDTTLIKDSTTGITVSTSTTTTMTNASTGGGNSHENLPPYYALAYIMKT